METVKLKTKQLDALLQVQKEKTVLNTTFDELNKREALILELLFEEKNIDVTQIKDLKLEGDSLVYELKTQEAVVVE